MRGRSHLFVAAGLAAFACVVLGPFVADFRGGWFGLDAVDALGTQWFYAYVDAHPFDPSALRPAKGLFHPFGKDLFEHTGSNVADAYLAMPWRRLLGPVAGYNAFCLLILALNGWGFSALARRVTDDRALLWAGSVLFAAHPFVLYELVEGRAMQALVALVPLALAATWRALDEGRPALGAAAGGILALLGYQYWFYGAFTGLAVLGLLAWGARADLRRAATVGAALLGTTAVLVAPVVVPMLTAVGAGEVPGLLDVSGWGDAVTTTTVEGAPIGLSVWQPLGGGTGFLLGDGEGLRLDLHQRVVTVSGLAALVVWALAPGRLPRGLVLAVAVPVALVAMGPVVVAGERWVANPVYQLAVTQLDFLKRLWFPSRAGAVLATVGSLVVVAACTQLRGLATAGVLSVLAVRAGELWLAGLAPVPTWSAEMPAGYHCLAEADEGALIELPLGWTQHHVVWQAEHGRPILGGMPENNPALLPEGSRELWAENTALKALVAASRGQAPSAWTRPDLDELTDHGFRWVVFRKDALHWRIGTGDATGVAQVTGQALPMLVTLLGPPLYEDERVAIHGLAGAELPCSLDEVERDDEPVAPRVLSPTGSVKALPSRVLQRL